MKAATLLAVLLTSFPVMGHTQWTSMRSRPDEILVGAFVSCPDNEDGSYGERVFVRRAKGKSEAEIHLGPRDEFAIFAGEVEGERDHRSADNLLGASFHFLDVDSRTGRNWAVPSLNLHLNVVRGDGSFEDCYTFMVLVTPLDPKRVLADP